MDLFAHAELRKTAERLRDRGMGLAADAQDRTIPNWSALAYMAILAVARMQETVHVDDVKAIFPHEPHHFNAWGAVWMRAIKDGVIERTGAMRPSTDPRKHKHQYALYRSLLKTNPGSIKS
jgi:hypothetical protein